MEFRNVLTWMGCKYFVSAGGSRGSFVNMKNYVESWRKLCNSLVEFILIINNIIKVIVKR